MGKVVGIYFSGTGNTKFCIEKFVSEIDANAICVSIEDKNCIKEIQENNFIVLGYPIFYSSLPKIMKDFLVENKMLFKGKSLFIMTTMGLFSGDGSGLAARVLKEVNPEIIGGLHLLMPDSICDEKVLKKSHEENKQIIAKTNEKISFAANKVKGGLPTQEGLSKINQLIGLFGQRLWFGHKTKKYSSKLKINVEQCIGCGKCVKLCPMKNLMFTNSTVSQKGLCTLCYRCVNECPKQAITLLGSKVIQQHHSKDYY
ncbi:EFR1 family ferrodoxin [Anaerorhabdus sp.]|jgi:ferredoxin|uniref:EFR1 family ferrodoxin n=1 Tax=Anaerorhabdus sp. TaxID=1872524 RepID=UPI002FCB96DE